MTDRDKLFKLVQSSKEPCDNGFCPYESDDVPPCCRCEAESLVDHLIAHGVTLTTDINVLTNGDRIRTMPDEELARTINQGCFRADEDSYCLTDEYGEPNCFLCVLTWLKQPVKEGVDNGDKTYHSERGQ